MSKPDAQKGAVCVTGAAGGIGVVLVRRLLEAGYAVSAWDVTPGALADISAPRFVVRAVDSRIRAQAEAAVADTHERFGRIDGLVTLAAIYEARPFLDIDAANWDLHFAINLKGALLAAQSVLPVMRAQRQGSIVLASSLMARTGGARSAAYAATKGGILGLARSMALDVAADNIRVNTVSPAIVDTAMPRRNLSETQMQARSTSIPMGRIATSTDVCEAILFLLDAENSFMTGQDIRLNGGAILF